MNNPMSEERRLCGRRRAERSYSMFKVRRGDLIPGKEQQLHFDGAAMKRYPTSKERWLHGCRRAKRSYSTFKVRRGNLVQGKEQQLRFAGAAMKRYPMSKVRETQVRW